MRTPFLPCAALLCAACTMIPRTTPPTQAVPLTWHDSAGGRATAAVPETPWWTAFPDTTLRGLIRAALARNTELRGAAENVSVADAYLRASRALLLPTLSASASASTGGSRSESKLSPSTYAAGVSRSTYDRYGVGADVWWDADLFGAQRSAIAAARAQLRATEEGRRAVSLAVVAAVADGYAGLRETDRLRAVLERALADRLRVLDVAQRRAGSGAAGDLDVVRARAEAEAIRRDLVDVAESAVHGENALSLLTGRAPGAIPRPAAEDEKPLAVSVPPSLPASLLQRRPDVRAAEQDLAGSAAFVGQMRAELLPNLTISANAGLSRNVSRNPSAGLDSLGRPTTMRVTNDSRGWTVGASLSQVLFAGGRNVANLHAAEASSRRVAIAYEATVLRALAEAEDAMASVRFAARRRTSLDSLVALTRSALQLAEGRYERGEAPLLDVLFAQSALLSAETGAVYAWYQQVAAVTGLYRALGGGWQAEETATEPAAGR